MLHARGKADTPTRTDERSGEPVAGQDADSRRVLPRILHLSRVGFVGGAERVMLTLTAGLKQYGYDPVIACPGGGLLEQRAGEADVRFAPMPFDRLRITPDPRVLVRYPRAWMSGADRLLHYCRDANIGLIHAHHPVGALYARRAVRELGLPLVLHMHDGPPMSRLYRLLLRQAARDACLVMCVSSAARSVLADAGGDLGKAEIVSNAVDATFIDPDICPAQDIAGRAGPHIGIFGVLEPRKGQDDFLEAAARLAPSFPSAHFWVVGSLELADKAAFKRRIEAMAAAPALTGRVTFTGHRDDIPALMQAMDVVVSASVSHESFGMVLAEAMALGRPVVTTAVGGTTEVVTHGVTGRVVPPCDPEALAAAIAQVLRTDPQAIAAAAAADVRARFSPAQFRQRIADLYGRVLAAEAR